MTTRKLSTPLPRAPRTSDSMARMFRSRVDTTTVGWTSGVSWVIRALKAYGETRIRPNTLSVTRTFVQAGDSFRCRSLGSSGGLTSAMRRQSRLAVSKTLLPGLAGHEVLGLRVMTDDRRRGLVAAVHHWTDDRIHVPSR